MLSQQFRNLSENERLLLIKAPALVAVLAAGKDGDISNQERAEALKQADIRTFSSPEILKNYYQEASKNFEQDFNETIKKYAPLDDGGIDGLKQEVNSIKYIINKLDEPLAKALSKSLIAYAMHVKKADARFVETFLFPFMNY